MFAFGCATTEALHYPQPQIQPQTQLIAPAPALPRGELLFIGLVVLVIIGLLGLAFKNNKAKKRKKPR